MKRSAQLKAGADRLIEYSLLSLDVSRGLRSSVALAGTWAICLLSGHPGAAMFAAPAAQSVSLPDVRGDYQPRLLILFALTLLLAFSSLVGTVAGTTVLGATLAIGGLALLAGCWRQLSSEYGPQFALGSALQFFLGISQPGDLRQGYWHATLALLGGTAGILVQLSGWFVRPQHPLRHASAETWVAVSDLITAMRSFTDSGLPKSENLTPKESELRIVVDRTLRLLESAARPRNFAFVGHLQEVTSLGARLATRVSAFHTGSESIRALADFEPVAPALDATLQSLASLARSAALTLITHRTDQFIALELRLARAQDLIRVLDQRLAGLDRPEAAHCRDLLEQIAALLSQIRSRLSETIDRGSTASGFALRLPELTGMSIRQLGAWLTPGTQLDPLLIRYTFRVAVVLMLAVAAYEYFKIPRGYWIAFTALVVLQPDYGGTRQKAGQRIAGTLGGSALASLLLWIKIPPLLLVLLGATMAFGFGYFLRRRYALAVFFVTIMLVLMTEVVTAVHLDFTVARLLSTIAGGTLALSAALLFWPKWEDGDFPKFQGAALRANRNYLDRIATHLALGKPFSGDVVRAKREAERANALAAASLQRLLTEPAHRRKRIERSAAISNYNQRLTRTLTVLAQQANKQQLLADPAFQPLVNQIAGTIESAAGRIEQDLPLGTSQIPIHIPAGGSSYESSIYTQLAKVLTEIEAMAIDLPISESRSS